MFVRVGGSGVKNRLVDGMSRTDRMMASDLSRTGTVERDIEQVRHLLFC